MWICDNWQDYELLDCSNGERLERWGKYILVRPDPQILWRDAAKHPAWKKADATYRRSSSGGGGWKNSRLPEQWNITYGDLKFLIRPNSMSKKSLSLLYFFPRVQHDCFHSFFYSPSSNRTAIEFA